MSIENISEQCKESIKSGFKGPIISMFRDSYLKMLFTRCSFPLGVLCEEKMSKEAIVSGK
jgi:hypothetical protein